jgi:hypothetical protein
MHIGYAMGLLTTEQRFEKLFQHKPEVTLHDMLTPTALQVRLLVRR